MSRPRPALAVTKDRGGGLPVYLVQTRDQVARLLAGEQRRRRPVRTVAPGNPPRVVGFRDRKRGVAELP